MEYKELVKVAKSAIEYPDALFTILDEFDHQLPFGVLNICDAPMGWELRPALFTFIGRPSPFGNPYKIGRDGTREEVIEKYRIFFRQQRLMTPITDNAYIDERIRGHFLVCHCAPKPCHGDVLMEYCENNPPTNRPL